MGQLAYINGFRGILCLWIVLFHYTCRYGELFDTEFMIKFSSGGKVGVFLFFCLSGFFCLATADKIEQKGCLQWAKNKYFRLFPSYLLSCIIIYIVYLFMGSIGDRGDTSCLNFIRSILMIPYLSPTLDGAHWYVFSLLRFYIFFIIVYKAKLINSFSFWLCIVLFVVAVNTAYHFKLLPAYTKILSSTVNEFIELRAISGILLFGLINNKDNKYIFPLALIIVFYTLKFHTIYIILFMSLIYILMVYPNRLKIVRTFLELPILLYIGRISYMWYLLHQNIGFYIINYSIKSLPSYLYEFIPYIVMFITLLFATVAMCFEQKYLTPYISKIK